MRRSLNPALGLWEESGIWECGAESPGKARAWAESGSTSRGRKLVEARGTSTPAHSPHTCDYCR